MYSSMKHKMKKRVEQSHQHKWAKTTQIFFLFSLQSLAMKSNYVSVHVMQIHNRGIYETLTEYKLNFLP